MKRNHLFFIGRTLCSILFLLAASANCHAKIMTFTLDNVFTTAGEAMTGSFDWTYTEGDFENGSGLFTELNIPRYGTNISDLVITIDLSSIEFSLVGNFHSKEVDINLSLLSPLSTSSSSLIDTNFDGINYASKYSVFGFGQPSYQGGFLPGGSVGPASAVPNPKPFWLLSSGLAVIAFSARRKEKSKPH